MNKVEQINYRHNPFTYKIEWEHSMEHDHTFFEIVLIIRSSADHIVNGITSRVSRGDMILLRPKDRHYFKITGKEPYLHRDIYVTQRDMQDICEGISDDAYEILEAQKMPFSIKLNGLQTDYIDSFCHKYDDIIDYTKTEKYDRAFFKAFCSHLVCLIYENNLLYTAIPTWLSELVNDIKNKKLFLTNTVDELVQRTSYSHTQFCRLFKRYFNTTFSQYLTDYKLDYSLTLLADKSKSILEISSHLGYDSTSYYITAFKKRFGVTPHRYRISRL